MTTIHLTYTAYNSETHCGRRGPSLYMVGKAEAEQASDWDESHIARWWRDDDTGCRSGGVEASHCYAEKGTYDADSCG